MSQLTQHRGRALPIRDEIDGVREAGARRDDAGAEFMQAGRGVFADDRPADPSLWTTVSGKATRFLARHVPTKSLRKIGPQPLVSFTFDDVPASACGEGAAILEGHGVRATYYACAGGSGAVSPSGRLASTDDIAALAARGHEIGCHTYSHRAVSTLSRRELAGDIDRNRAALAAICPGNVLRNFAFPYGDMSFAAKRYLERRFDSCRSGRLGLNAGSIDLGALRSWPLENASINRARIVKLIDETVRRHGWLVFISHGLEKTPRRYGITPDLLAFAVAAAKSGGCRVTTIGEALRLAGATKSEELERPLPRAGEGRGGGNGRATRDRG
jgi:peptidoglycan/xylan/chitin deacetylase (PgdA/CDA1 family)